MNQKIYRICLMSIVIIAVMTGFFYYNQIKDNGKDTQGALLVMEASYYE